jgi:hypothetical protein
VNQHRIKAVEVGSGKYNVTINGFTIKGLIIGGNSRYFIQLAGIQLKQCFPSINRAKLYLVEVHAGIK